MLCLGLVAVDKAGSGLEDHPPHGDDFCSQGAVGRGYGAVCGGSLVAGKEVGPTGTRTFGVSAWGGVEGFTKEVAI